jgi:hypothetical protein
MIGRDISRGEAVEHELTAFLGKRHEARVAVEGERPAEEMWMESERRHAARRREDNRQAWAEYHRDQAARHRAVLEALASHHEEQAARLGGRQPQGPQALVTRFPSSHPI